MRSQPQCLVCALNQAIKTLQAAKVDPERQVRLLHEAMASLKEVTLSMSPAEISTVAIRAVSSRLEEKDAFREIKHEHIRLTLALYPDLKRIAEDSPDPLFTGIRLSASANLIDLGARQDIDLTGEMQRELQRSLKKSDFDYFVERVRGSRSILWIADNAGETVLDRLVLDRLQKLAPWIAVKEGAVLNDATMEDAIASGLQNCGKLISTGSDCLGVLTDESSSQFLDLLYNTDLVVAKGHANFETLDTLDREIFFLLKAKCPLVAGELGVAVGDTAFIAHRGR